MKRFAARSCTGKNARPSLDLQRPWPHVCTHHKKTWFQYPLISAGVMNGPSAPYMQRECVEIIANWKFMHERKSPAPNRLIAVIAERGSLIARPLFSMRRDVSQAGFCMNKAPGSPLLCGCEDEKARTKVFAARERRTLRQHTLCWLCVKILTGVVREIDAKFSNYLSPI
jgi:hypothetical protein